MNPLEYPTLTGSIPGNVTFYRFCLQKRDPALCLTEPQSYSSLVPGVSNLLLYRTR